MTAGGAAQSSASVGGTGAAQEPQMRLVLLLSVDQMRADYLDRFGDELDGGLRRLLDEGAFFLNARQDHAVTATAPGHAVMLSGIYPAKSGIVDNSWWDRRLGRRERAANDPDYDIVGLAVPDDSPGGSPRQFLGSSLVGWMKDREPRTKAVSISRKDRSAVLMAPEAEHAYWFHWSGRFITSTYYRAELPPWVQAFNARDWLADYQGGAWKLLKSNRAYGQSRPDDYEGERGARGFGNTFPHPLPAERQPLGTRILTTPFIDEAVLDLGRAAIESVELGNDEITDVLALSLSATDSVGHSFGPFSREIHDQILRLDLMLGDFLDFVDDTVGLEHVLVVLTADHGVVRLPEYSRDLGEHAERLRMGAVRRGIDAHLSEEFGGEGWFDMFSYGWLSLDREQAAERGADPAKLIAEARDYVASLDFVVDVFTAEELQEDRAPRSEIEELARRSHYPGRSGDLYLVHGPHSQWETGSAANHQSPYQYDRHVPLILRGTGIEPGPRAEFVALVDLAPTLASLLGLSAPAEVDGRLLPGLWSEAPAAEEITHRER